MNPETLSFKTIINKLYFLKKPVYNSYLKRKITKSVKRSKIFTQQPKALENPSIADIKSSTIEYPKTSHKLAKTTRQPESLIFQACSIL